jgi:peptidoglycan/LPS O-acetylase OafA/YrhL
MSNVVTKLARKNSARSPVNANDTVLRATGVVSLLAIGAIHFLQIVPTTEQTPLLGVSFLFLIGASIAVAFRLATRHDRRTWQATAALSGAAIAGYLFTRTFKTPLDNQDAGNWSCMLGLAALFVETTLLTFSALASIAIRTPESSSGRARGSRESGREVAGVVPGESSAA